MYGQANYGQFGKGPQKPMPSAYQQHLQAPPPPPPPHNFQQGHTTPLPPVTQQAPLARPPQISQLGPRLYHHGLPAQNAYQIPSGVPPLHGPPEILRPPQPYGALPPPPPLSQGQRPYRATVHPPPPPPPYTGGVQDLRHIPPLPPPSTSGFFTTTTFGSSIPSIIGDSQGSSMAPPPPPSSMPPIPPSPPLSSSLANLGDSNLSVHSDFDPSSNKHSSLERVLDHVDGDVASKDARHNTLMRDGSQSLAARSSCEVGSLAGDGSSFDGSLRLDLRPSPPKPTEEKTVQKIEALCQDIAKNGPNVEVITFQNESRNPEFGFLFGGEPGSEAAIAHEYFQWLKRKCILAYKVHEDKRESALGPFTNDSSSQPNYFMASAGCTSPADSDMEMEDDITFSEKDQEVNHSIEAVGCNSDFVCKEVDVKDRLHGRQILLKGHPVHDMLSEKVLSESSNLHKQSKEPKILYHQDHSTFGKSASGACSPTIEAAECALANNRKRSTSVSPEGSSPSRGSTASKAINLRNSSNQPGKSGSPFRLLQDYASDDSAENDDEPFHEDRNPLAVPPSIKVDSSSSEKATGNHLGSDVGLKSLHRTEKAKVALVGADVISKRDRDLKENEEKEAKFESASPKVDEFGRLVREGSSDSDYDSRYTNRRDKRGRNRSHSRSPIDRSRSSWRRREKRSRSRSWSPRNRRSRSRSPTYRRAGEFGGENMRRDRARLPECFDFRRGRCYRGASCRYMHHEVDKSDRSRHHRSRQNYLDDPLSSSNSKIKEEGKNTSAKVSKHLHDDANSQEIRFSQNVRCATKDGIIDWRRQDIAEDGLQSIKSDHCDKLIDSDAIKCGGPALLSATMSDKGMIQVPDYEKIQEELAPNQPLSVDSFPSRCVSDADILKSCGDTPQNMFSFVKTSVLQSQSIAKVQNTDSSPQQMTNSSVADSFPVQKSLSSPKKFSNIGTFPKTTLSSQPLPSASSHGQSFSSEPFSLQSLPSKDVSPPSYSAANTSHHLLQLPPPPPLPLAHGSGAAHMPQLPTDQSSIPQIASYPLHSAPVDNLYTSQAPLPNQHSQLPLAPNSSWPSFPPPPPRPYDSSLNSGTATLDVLSQFQHSHFPSRCDFNQSSIRPYPTELPSHSQVGEFLHRAHPSMESHRPTLHMEDFRSGNPPSQPFGGSSPLRDTHFTYHLVRDINSSNSSGQGSLNQQHVPSSQELPVSRMLPFSSDVHPPGEVLKSSSQMHPYSHTQQPSYGMQYSQSDSILSMPGKTVPMPRYPPDLMDRNQSSSNPDFGAPRISAHYNLFASTYEQPLASISSKEFSREKGALNGNKYDAPSGLTHVAVDGLGVGSIGQRQTTSSPRSARAVEQSLHGLGGDQYDPLFDSIDPLSKPQRKNDHGQKPELTSDSDLMVRLSGSNKPLDLEENNRHKEVETVASATSLDNDEYGETADAEVGVIEEESFSNPDGEATAGENEIDQKKSPGKSKKKKDSRSTKLFKVSIANFVKEVLKPSWREGNMSKEAFKTIVKKTVDKVSGAMKSHQVPKSQAKIDHYIDSSQRKLTKLVMGYVDKYVKV